MRMKILINTSVINQGGAVQVALNVLRYTISDKSHEYSYILSEVIASSDFLDLENQLYIVTQISPAKFLSAGKTRKQIKTFEQKINPDIIYSIGAPSYLKFKTKEVLRLTNPFVIGANKVAFSTLSRTEKFIRKLKIFVHRQYINSNHFIITQTATAKKDIVKNLGIPEENIKVVPNTYAPIFVPRPKKKLDDHLKILCLAAPYPHKNLSLVPLVANTMIKKGFVDFKFILTIPENMHNAEIEKLNGLIETYGLSDYITDIGKVDLKDCPSLYSQSDIVFLPTLLEIFSATHIEAMAMNVPIVTTDMDFCREICKDGALYFEPKNYEQAADQILSLVKNDKLRNELIGRQQEIIQKFPEAENIYKMHIAALEAFMEI